MFFRRIFDSGQRKLLAPIMTTIVPIVPASVPSWSMQNPKDTKPGQNKFFAYEVVQALGKEYRVKQNELNIESALKLINASVPDVKRHKEDRIELMLAAFNEAGVRTLSEATEEIIQGIPFDKAFSVGSEPSQQNLTLNAAERLHIKNMLTLHVSVMDEVNGTIRDSDVSLNASLNPNTWEHKLGKMIFDGQSKEAIAAFINEHVPPENQQDARDKIKMTGKALQETEDDLPQIVEKRTATLRARGMTSLMDDLIPPKKLLSDIQTSVDKGQLKFGLPDVVIPHECGPPGCDYKEFSIDGVKIGTFGKITNYFVALRTFLQSSTMTLRKGLALPDSSSAQSHDAFLITPDILENHLYNVQMQHAQNYINGAYIAITYDQLGRRRLASRVGNQIQSIEDYNSQICDLPLDGHFKNQVHAAASKLEKAVSEFARKQQTGNAGKETKKGDKSGGKGAGKGKSKRKDQPCYYGANCTKSDCPYTHPWDVKPSDGKGWPESPQYPYQPTGSYGSAPQFTDSGYGPLHQYRSQGGWSQPYSSQPQDASGHAGTKPTKGDKAKGHLAIGDGSQG